jgi:uncharacterized protein YcbX
MDGAFFADDRWLRLGCGSWRLDVIQPVDRGAISTRD